MKDLRNIFPYFGLVTHNDTKKLYSFVILQICSILIMLTYWMFIPWPASDRYILSHNVSRLVLLLTALSHIVTLLESLRTIEELKLLTRKMTAIDFYLNSTPGNQQLYMKGKFLITYGIVLLCGVIAFPCIVNFGEFEGPFNYYFYPACWLKLRTFQITVWLDQFAYQMILFNRKLDKT